MVTEDLQNGDSVTFGGETYVYKKVSNRAFWTIKGQEISGEKAKLMLQILPTLKSGDIKRRGSGRSAPVLPRPTTQQSSQTIGGVTQQPSTSSRGATEVELSKESLQELAKILKTSGKDKEEDKPGQEENPAYKSFRSRMRKNVPIARMFTNKFEEQEDIDKGITPKSSITRMGRDFANMFRRKRPAQDGPEETETETTDQITPTAEVETPELSTLSSGKLISTQAQLKNANAVADAEPEPTTKDGVIEVKLTKESLDELGKILTAAMEKNKPDQEENPAYKSFRSRMRKNVPFLRTFTDKFEEQEDIDKGVTPKQSIVRMGQDIKRKLGFDKQKETGQAENEQAENAGLEKDVESSMHKQHAESARSRSAPPAPAEPDAVKASSESESGLNEKAESAELEKEVESSMRAPRAMAAEGVAGAEGLAAGGTAAAAAEGGGGLGSLLGLAPEILEALGLGGLALGGKNLVKRGLKGAWNLGKKAVKGTWNLGKKAVKGTWNLGKKAVKGVSNLGKKAWNWGKEKLGSAWKWGKEKMAPALDWGKKKLGTAWEWGKGKLGGIGKKLVGKEMAEKIAKVGFTKAAGGIPVIGGLITGGVAGYDKYKESGSLGKAVTVGLGTGVGTWLGEAGGALAGGVGEIPGGIAGGIAGEEASSRFADWAFGSDEKDSKSASHLKSGEGIKLSSGLGQKGGIGKNAGMPADKLATAGFQPQSSQLKNTGDQLKQKLSETAKAPPVIINNQSSQNINSSGGGGGALPYIPTSLQRGSLDLHYFAF